MTAITDDREVARDKFRCMDCRGKYTLHTHHGFGYVTATWSRPGPVPRYLAVGPSGWSPHRRYVVEKSNLIKKCRNDVVLVSMSLVLTTAMTPWPWRRSDRTCIPCSRPRLAPYAVGTLRRCSQGDILSSRVRARRREMGLRGWGSIVPIHTRPIRWSGPIGLK